MRAAGTRGALILVPFLFWIAGCGTKPAETPKDNPEKTETPPKASDEVPGSPTPTGSTREVATPTEYIAAAQNAIGAEAQVLAWGDLALNGKAQILALHRLPKPPKGVTPGNLLKRAVVLEKHGDAWKEVLLCDQHLRNPQGYLAATPISPVPAWRLQYERNDTKGLVLYFTPLEKPAGGYITTIGVRWNPQVSRYQSLDRNYENFLGETPSLN